MASDALDIRLLGQFTVLRAGQPAALPPSRKTRALLAYLIMSGRPQRRDQLCTMFWDAPDKAPDDARGSLRWSLSKIRDLVDGPNLHRLVADREMVRFEPGSASIDVQALAAGAEQASTLPLEQLATLAGNLDGEFLAGLELPDCEAFQAWCAAQRQDMRTAAVAVLRALAQRLDSQPLEALPYARRLVALAPDDGDARALLVRLLLAAGRWEDAEQQQALWSAERAVPADRIAPASPASKDALAAPAPPRDRTALRALPSDVEQRVQFCRAHDGVRLAYATVGRGPPLVKAANWMNHLEMDWRNPGWRPFLEVLAAQHTLVRYDARGNGLSDWDVADISFEAFVDDLIAVVEACGLKRFPLVGFSQGCAVSIAYAVRFPERVERLILFGGYVKGWKLRGDAADVERRQALVTLMRHGWGSDNPAFRQVFTSFFMPKARPSQMQFFNELQRATATPENAVRLAETLGDIDVGALLPQVRVPTLVMHCRDDGVSPHTEGRALAAGIPGARFVTLDSSNHMLIEREPAWPVMVSHLNEFLAAR